MQQSDIDAIFSSVASKYDIMNDIMSFGLHRIWKKELCSRIAKGRVGHLLDVAGGTGDVALKSLDTNKNLNVTVCDINLNVLEIGRKKALNRGNLAIEWVCASAECLPFQNESFDYYTIAFGIRNVPDRASALKEAHRVLKPHGRFLCLEFSPLPKKNAFSIAYDLYSFFVIPKIGKFITGNKDAYLYLVNSIRAFPEPQQFTNELVDAGFLKTTSTSVCGGIVTLYSGWKI